jgi:dienelactone hydrolase
VSPDRLRDHWPRAALEETPAHELLGGDLGIQALTFENEPYRGAPTRVFAYLGMPRWKQGRGRSVEDGGDTRVPGVVLVHGGGGRAFREWVAIWNARGYAAIAMDLAGRGPDRERLPDGGPDQGSAEKFLDPGSHWGDHWTYHSVAAITRAHSLLRAQPGVDPDRIGLAGISWGGYLTCIVAGVDARFRCAVPLYGCGYLQHNSTWQGDFAGMGETARRHWHERCDPAVYLPQATMPMLWMNGTNDGAYPLDSYQLSYAAVAGPMTLSVRIRMPHGHAEGFAPREIEIFFDDVLRGGAPLPTIGALAHQGREVSAAVGGPHPLTGGLLAYTADARPWQEWRTRPWQGVPARFADGRVVAELPDDAMVYFLAVTDDRGAYVSCRHVDRTPAAPKA